MSVRRIWDSKYIEIVILAPLGLDFVSVMVIEIRYVTVVLGSVILNDEVMLWEIEIQPIISTWNAEFTYEFDIITR
jgi:hypothetical protein